MLTRFQNLFTPSTHLNNLNYHSRVINRRNKNAFMVLKELFEELFKKPNSRNSVLLILSLTALILIVRKTDALLNPQFWAEDGSVFFLQQYENGASALFQPYAGYLHFVPRLVAFFAESFFPYALVPAIYNYSSLIITLVVTLSIFSPRFQINNKPLVALAIVLVPHYSNEIFLNVTNLNWILAIMLIVVLFKKNPGHSYGNIIIQYVCDLTIIIFCGLSGPFIVFLMPFFGWKWFTKRKLYNSLIFLAVVIVSLVQLSFIASEPTNSQQINVSFEAFNAVIGYKMIGSLFLGQKIAYGINPYVLSLLYLAALVLFLGFAYNKKDSFSLTCIGISLIFLLATFYRFVDGLEILIPPENGQRYFYIPYIMVTWSLIALQGKQAKWKNILLPLILISSLTSGFHSSPFVDYNWNLYSESIGKQDVSIPINPPGWQFEVKAHPKLIK